MTATTNQLTVESTKKEIADYLYNSFITKTRNDGTKFYCVDSDRLDHNINRLLVEVICDIHNNMPNDIEYNWIHRAIASLTDWDLNDENFDLCDVDFDFELIYTTEIISAIAYLDIDIYQNYEQSIASVIQEAYSDYMRTAVYELYELICSIQESLQN